MGGGSVGKTIAPETPNIRGAMRVRTAFAECASPLRWEYGFKGTKIIPWFAAAPEKLKPATENVPSDSGTSASKAETCFPIAFVYSSEAPDGAWITMMKYPWSSSGTNPVGTRVNTKYVSPRPAKNSTAIATLNFST